MSHSNKEDKLRPATLADLEDWLNVALPSHPHPLYSVEGGGDPTIPANLRWRPYYVDPPPDRSIAEWYYQQVQRHAGTEELIAAGGNGYEQENPRDELYRYRNGVDEGLGEVVDDEDDGAEHAASEEEGSDFSGEGIRLNAEYAEAPRRPTRSRPSQAAPALPKTAVAIRKATSTRVPKVTKASSSRVKTAASSRKISSTVNKSRYAKQCPHCLKTFGSLQRHIDTVHLGIKSKLCAKCGVGFAENNKMRRHEAICKGKWKGKGKLEQQDEDEDEDEGDGEGDEEDEDDGGDLSYFGPSPDDDEGGSGGAGSAGGMGDGEAIRQMVRLP